MKKLFFLMAITALLALGLTLSGWAKANPKILMKTSKGDIIIELFLQKAPVTVENFLCYVDDGFYDGTIFHRVIKGFMIQGGGYTTELHRKSTRPPIKNEATNGLSNKRGTIAMARTMEINSATAQFFINLVDNTFLDHRDNTPEGYGYCVFGRVIQGMDVVDAIAEVKTMTRRGMRNVPRETIEIISVRRLENN